MLTTDESAVRDVLSRTLDDDQARLVADWVTEQRPEPLDENDLRREAVELVECLKDALAGTVPISLIAERHDGVRSALRALSTRRARAGASPSGTAVAILSFKHTLLGAIERQTDDPELRYRAALLVSELLDSAGVFTFTVFNEGREEIIRRQHDQMLELSTPVIRLWRHVLAVPLIGTLDSARTQVVMNGLLEAIQAHEARIAIIDITGVPTVDTAVAQHLLQTISAVRLMGADCLVSGIRPAIAQTITQLGIDLSHIDTRASLADALAAAIRLLDDEPAPR